MERPSLGLPEGSAASPLDGRCHIDIYLGQMAQTQQPTEAPSESLWRVVFDATCEILDLDARETPDDLSLALQINNGLTTQAITGLLDGGIPESDLFQIVIPRRTWYRRRESHKPLTPDESDRAQRVAGILALAQAVFSDRGRALHWLGSPKRRLDGRRPFDLMNSSVGAKIVEDTLLQAYYGNVA